MVETRFAVVTSPEPPPTAPSAVEKDEIDLFIEDIIDVVEGYS